MKNVADIQKEVDAIITEMADNKKRKPKQVGYLKPSAVKKLKSRKDYLLTCIQYLHTSPTPEFIQKEKDRLLNRNNVIMESLPKAELFLISDEVDMKKWKKAKRDYEKLMDLPKIRLQLKTLQFIS